MNITSEDSNNQNYKLHGDSNESEDKGWIVFFKKNRSYIFLVVLSGVPFFIFHLRTAFYITLCVLLGFIVYNNLSSKSPPHSLSLHTSFVMIQFFAA